MIHYKLFISLFLTSLLSLTLLCSCKDDEQQTESCYESELTIFPYKGLSENWNGIINKEAYVFTQDGSYVKKTAVSIKGFDGIYEEGYRYVINAKVTYPIGINNKNMQDGDFRYEMINVISKEKAETMELNLTVDKNKVNFRNWMGEKNIPAYSVTTETGIKETIISITGFDDIYEPGYKYEITVTTEHDSKLMPEYWPNPYGGYRYKLKDILSKDNQ